MGAPFLLNPKEINFPDVEQALCQPNGLLAIGGDLSPERILAAYRRGIFPWFNEGDPLMWWSPDPRMIIYPQQFKAPRSLRKIVRRQSFHVTQNQAFAELIGLCAEVHAKRSGTWITDSMRQAYINLHQLGHAHSIEVWLDNTLVGGLYGVSLPGVFSGESMVSTVSNASKIALAYLVDQCPVQGYALIDCQLPSQHLAELGAQTIARQEYIELLNIHLHPESMSYAS